MDAINHHLTDHLLMAYASGNLPEAFNLIVATHVSMCDECRARLESYEAVGGAVIEDAGSETLSDDAFSAVLARINEGPEHEEIRVGTDADSQGFFPAPLTDYVGTDPEGVAWRGLGGGVKQSVIDTGGAATARLLYIPAGMKMPQHSHKGLEATLVLQGAFSDQDGRFGRGDIEVGDDELDHTPVADAGEDCICLAVTDARLRFSGWLPRIAQPFLGI